MADAFSIKFSTDSAFAGLDALVAKSKAATRPAAQAGAQVLYNEVKVRVPVSDQEHVNKKGEVISPGALRDSIYQVYSERNSHEYLSRSTYHISYNAKKAPHGWLVEFGHWQRFATYQGKDGRWYTSKTPLPTPRRVAARPYLRPAYDAVYAIALEAAKARFIAEMRSK